MKTIDNFTADVMNRAKKMKKRKNIIGAVCSVCTLGVLVFLVLFSNIIDFGGIGPYAKAYKKYMQAYVSAAGENYSSLRILDAQSAVFTFEGKPLFCSMEAQSDSEFELTVEKEESADDKLNVEFDGDSATVEGEVDGEEVRVVLNLTKDVQNVSPGIWSMFASEVNGSFSISGGQNWIVLMENGDAYCGEGSTTWLCEFISVGDRILKYTRDQESGVAELSLFEVLPEEVFGYVVLKETLYEAEGKMPFVPYYRLLSESEAYDYDGGTFTAKYVEMFVTNDAIDESELYSLADINWRLFPYGESSEATAPKLELELTADGTAKLNGKKAGVWFRLKDKPLVVLDKTHDILGRAFTLYGDRVVSANLSESAFSYHEYSDYYKVGYHTFKYYLRMKEVTVYWGSLYKQEEMNKELVYDKEYVVYAQDIVLDEATGEYVTTDWKANGNYSLIFREDGRCEMWVNGRRSTTCTYVEDHSIKTAPCVNFSTRLRIPVSGSAIEGNLEMSNVRYLYLGAGKLTSKDVYFNDQGVAVSTTQMVWLLKREA